MQIFQYHGQPNNKTSETPEGWEAKKAAGKGGEFGGGLPQACVTVNGKPHQLAQMGAILRMFAIKFGYYNPKDWKMARYADQIVDTYSDVLGKATPILFGPESEKQKNIEAFLAIAKLYNQMVERNLNHHNGKWAAGNTISIADFCMASYIGNFIMND